MKANKFFAAAMAALMMVGFASCNKDKGGSGTGETPDGGIVLTPATATLDLKDNTTITVKANKSVKWSVVSATKSITISTEEGAEVVVTAVKEGAATLVASAGAESEFCTITVKGEGGSGPKDPVKLPYSEVYPIILDAVTFDFNKDIIKGDFRCNEDNQLYIWSAGETYNAGEAKGLNSYGQEGYFALTQAGTVWSGGGFCLTNANGQSDIAGVNEMIKKILAEPDQWFFHMALKSTDNAVHQFYMLTIENKDADIIIGNKSYEVKDDNGVLKYVVPPFADFDRLGGWGEIDVPMSKIAPFLSSLTFKAGDNILCFSSGAAAGAQLNMDAFFFYKK